MSLSNCRDGVGGSLGPVLKGRALGHFWVSHKVKWAGPERAWGTAAWGGIPGQTLLSRADALMCPTLQIMPTEFELPRLRDPHLFKDSFDKSWAHDSVQTQNEDVSKILSSSLMNEDVRTVLQLVPGASRPWQAGMRKRVSKLAELATIHGAESRAFRRTCRLRFCGQGSILLDNRCQRPKRLFMRAEHVLGDVAEQGRLEEIFSQLMSLPARHNGGPFGDCVTHLFLYLCKENKKSPWASWLWVLWKWYNLFECLNCRKL